VLCLNKSLYEYCITQRNGSYQIKKSHKNSFSISQAVTFRRTDGRTDRQTDRQTDKYGEVNVCKFSSRKCHVVSASGEWRLAYRKRINKQVHRVRLSCCTPNNLQGQRKTARVAQSIQLLDNQLGNMEIDSQQGPEVIRFPKKSGHTISFPEVKRSQREAKHSLPSIAEDIKTGALPPLHYTPSRREHGHFNCYNKAAAA
jgi:hypothetical protein